MSDEVVDVAVVGGGVVGAAIARELAGRTHPRTARPLSVTVLEARQDVGDGTSKANTAILHTGFDATPATLEARLVRRGHTLLSSYARATGIAVERTGALLVAWTDEELAALPALAAKARTNGCHHVRLVEAAEVHRQVPALGEGVLGGLLVPDESVICTWSTTLALATDAVGRGARVVLDRAVTGVQVGADATTLDTHRDRLRARWVVNAAGLGADLVDRLFGFDRFTVIPRRGELIVFDKAARPLADRIVLPVPSSVGKGVLIAPTVYGNVMLGPTAEDLTDRTATGTTRAGLDTLLAKGGRLMPALLEEEVTATYAGLRAATARSDYLIEADAARRYVLVGGIRSTGLSAGMAIAEHVADLLTAAEAVGAIRAGLPPPPAMPNLGEAGTRPYADATRIAADAAYGRVVCFCERVTEGEIRDTFATTLPPRTLEGLRRRTRAMNGRCQGFSCGAAVAGLLAAGRGQA